MLIENKSFNKIQLGKNYSTLILICLNSPVAQGFSLNEMRKTIKVMDKVELSENDSAIEVEKEDLEIIKASIDRTKWGVCDKEIVSFCDYMAGL